MDELQALRELRHDVEPAAPRRLAELRAGLFRSMHTPPPRRPRLPKLAWRIGLAGTLAVGILAGITVVQGNGHGPGGGVLAPRTASAAVFLERAASTVAEQPDNQPRPRDDQWVYTKHLVASATIEGDDPTDPDAKRGRLVQEDEQWFRFDGKEVASKEPGGDDLHRIPLDLKGYDDRYPAQIWNYRTSLPSDTEHLLAAIHEEVKRIYPDNPEFHQGEGLNNRTVWLIGVLLGADAGAQPSPELRAALYRALAKVPGVTITENVTDLTGRKAVLVGQNWREYSFGILLDPESYAYLGSSTRVQDGKVVEGTALLKAGIVDEPGELP